MKITKQQLKEIIREELRTKSRIISNEEERLLREGLWTNIKHFASKFGSMEKGGSILKRSANAQEAASKYQDILSKESNKLIKDMMAQIKQEAPEFPNDKDPDTFASALTDFFILYDSLVQATEKYRVGVPLDKQEEGALDPVAANEIIRDLRSVLKKVSDFELADTYKHALEEETLPDDETVEELFGRGKDKWAEKEKELAADEEGGEGEPKKKGVLDPDSELETTKGLKSMKLPAILGILGGAMGALAWMTKAKWFTDIVGTAFKEGGYKFVTDPVTSAEALTTAVEDQVKPGEGILRVVERLSGTDLTGTGATKADLLKAMASGGLPPEGLAQLGLDGPAEFVDAWKSQVLSVPDNTPLSEIFTGEFSGKTGVFGLSMGPFQKLVTYGMKIVAKKAGKTVVSTGFTAAGGGAVGVGAAASVLSMVGIAAATAGAAIAALRKKSTSDYGSRARLIDDVYNELKPVPVPAQLEPIVPVPEEPEDEETDPSPEGPQIEAEKLLSKFKVGDIVMYTEVDPKEGERDVSVAQITALPGGEALEEVSDGSHGSEILDEDNVPGLATQFDSKHNRWGDDGDKDKWGNNKKVFAQLQIIAVKSKDRDELGKMAKRPVNAAPVFRDEGDGFKSYITKVEDADPSEFEDYTAVQKPKKPLPTPEQSDEEAQAGEEDVALKALKSMGIDLSQPGEGGARQSVKTVRRAAPDPGGKIPKGLEEEQLNEQKVLKRWSLLAGACKENK